MSIQNTIIHDLKNYKSAKGHWDAWKAIYEGNEELEENKRYFIKQRIESLNHIPAETMIDTYYRYIELMDSIQEAQIIIDNYAMIRKFMWSLPNARTMYSVVVRRIEKSEKHESWRSL